MPDTQHDTHLPLPARYFPIIDGRYSAKAGLYRFPTDFGNGLADQQVFQFDTDFKRCRDNKLAARQQALNEYVCMADHSEDSLEHTNQFIIEQLARGYPDFFRLRNLGDTFHLDCMLTGNEIVISRDHTLVSSTYHSDDPAPVNLFDALALELQEDLCVMHVASATTRLCAAHLCAANHWAAPDKLGMDMFTLHKQVPEFTQHNRAPDKLLQGIVKKQQPYIRFAWGISENRCFNRHPRLADTMGTGHGDNSIFMRIERQLLYPMQDKHTVLFSIKTLFRDCSDIKEHDPEAFTQLVRAIETMGIATLNYKGIDRDNVLSGLAAL